MEEKQFLLLSEEQRQYFVSVMKGFNEGFGKMLSPFLRQELV